MILNIYINNSLRTNGIFFQKNFSISTFIVIEIYFSFLRFFAIFQANLQYRIVNKWNHREKKRRKISQTQFVAINAFGNDVFIRDCFLLFHHLWTVAIEMMKKIDSQIDF
jgi:hypothetical protein